MFGAAGRVANTAGGGAGPVDPVVFSGDTLLQTVSTGNRRFYGMVDNTSNQYIAFGGIPASSTCFIYSSSNGSTFSAETIAQSGVFYSGAFDGTTYVLVGGNGSTAGRIATSTNGTTWTARTTNAPSNTVFYDVVWSSNHGLFIAVGQGGSNVQVCCTSPNGTTWTSRTLTDTPLSPLTACSIEGNASDGKSFIGGWYTSGGCGYTSTNGTSWGGNATFGLRNNQTYTVKYAPIHDLWFAVDSSNVGKMPNLTGVPNSPFTTLTTVQLPQQYTKGFIDSDGNFCYASFGQVISTDGTTTESFTPTASATNMYQAFDGQYYVCGFSGANAVLYSLDI